MNEEKIFNLFFERNKNQYKKSENFNKEGTTAFVRDAWDLGSNSKVIIKLYKEHIDESSILGKRAIHTPANISNPHISQYRRIEKINDGEKVWLFSVWEFIEGIDFNTYLKRLHAYMKTEEYRQNKEIIESVLINEIILPVLNTISEIHSKDEVHGDLHGGNIIITSMTSGSFRTKVTITDFGSSSIMEDFNLKIKTSKEHMFLVDKVEAVELVKLIIPFLGYPKFLEEGLDEPFIHVNHVAGFVSLQSFFLHSESCKPDYVRNAVRCTFASIFALSDKDPRVIFKKHLEVFLEKINKLEEFKNDLDFYSQMISEGRAIKVSGTVTSSTLQKLEYNKIFE